MIVPLSALFAATHGVFRLLGFRSQRLTAAGRGVHLYARAGHGRAPPALLIHGLGANASSFLQLARTLVQECRQVVALELPGHGRSTLRAEEAPATLVECGQVVGAAVVQLGEPAVLIGNSLGGALALHAAAGLPAQVCGVVGLNPAGAPLEGAAREVVLGAFRGGDAKAALEMHRLLYRNPPRLAWLFARDLGVHFTRPPVQQFVSEMQEDLPGIDDDVLANIRARVLILWGEDDRLLPASSVPWFREHLPRAHVELVPRCGHLPQMERPRLVSARVTRFLREL